MEDDLAVCLWFTPNGSVKCNVEKRHLKIEGKVWCSKCRRHRWSSYFNKSSRMTNGRQPYCRDCDRTYQEGVRARRKGK